MKVREGVLRKRKGNEKGEKKLKKKEYRKEK